VTAPASRPESRAFLALAAAAVVGLVMSGLGGCTSAASSDDDGAAASPTSSPLALEPTLADAAPDGFFVGVTVGGGGHLGGPSPQDDPANAELVAAQFSSVTPENAAKWEVLRPTQDTFDFEAFDAVVDAAEANGQRVRGHTLLWHSQNPAWLTSGTFTPDELRELLQEHITTVVGRYAGRVAEWDVANEIFTDDGVLRQENPFIAALGVGIVADALRWAHEADPEAKLFLNDYDVETPGPKVDAYLALVADLQAQGVPLDGMGLQSHLSTQLGRPKALQSVIESFAALDLDVEITELDVRMPVSGGAPSDADLQGQAEYFADVAAACMAVERCTGITVWGVSDKNSWVPFTFPGEGAALMFDEELAPKPAFGAFRDALTAGR
jgi:endo-1,4-beta-xylanase